MKVNAKLGMTPAEIKTLRKVFNALSAVPFHRTPKPALDFRAIETRLRLSDAANHEFNTSEIESMMSACDALTNEFPDEQSMQLYVGSSIGQIASVKNVLEAHCHAAV